ncbi:hypothetical protein QTP86_028673 [Hemibagrus guttatus]|nr:hypothetical protein QTP86_028673 [Hemibagrus guttatus]
MYERSRTVVRCAVGQTEEFKVEVGLHQGSALSPFLFAIVMDQLSEEVRQESPWTMMFADDIVICSESREQVEENLERWRFALERRGMKVSGSKTEYMCVNEREGSGTVRLQGEEVKKVQEFKYLGSTVQSNGECGKEGQNQSGGHGAGGGKKDDKDKKKKYEPPIPTRVGKKKKRTKGPDAASKLPLVTPHTQCRLKLLKQERIKDYLLMEEEFIRNQEQMKPLEEKQEEERSKVDDLRGTPMSVGNLEEIIDDNHAIVSTSVGSEHYVSILSFVDKDLLEPGCSVLLNHKESVELPLTHPEYYEEMGIKPPKGVILYGPPGTGSYHHHHRHHHHHCPSSSSSLPIIIIIIIIIITAHHHHRHHHCPSSSSSLPIIIIVIITAHHHHHHCPSSSSSSSLPIIIITAHYHHSSSSSSLLLLLIIIIITAISKTLLAKAVANQTSATFLRVVGSELIQKYLGDGPKLVRELFRVAEEHAPSIVFIDEIDAIGTKRHFLQLFRRDPKAFPGQPKDIVSPACLGSSPGPLPGGACPEHLSRETSRRHPKQMPEPPQLPPFDVEEQRLYSELLPGDRAPYPISKGAPRHPTEEAHFGRLYPGSYPFGHDPELMTIDLLRPCRYDSNSGGEREIQRTMLELLNQLDGFDSRGDVKVIMATNRIETLDPALIRPGRIDRKIEFPLPDEKTKKRIFQIHTSRMTVADDVTLDDLILAKDDLSGADIKAICTEAGLMALRERRMKVTNEDFKKSKENVLYKKQEGTPEGLYL